VPVDAATKTANSEVLAPFILGVTGHRDLRAEDGKILSQQVREILLDLKKQFPSTPLILISALAEGADRLVASVALEPAIAARLIVPLPMPLHCYKEDFTTPASLAEFTRLLEQAERQFELPLHEGNTEEGLRQGEQRNLQYEDAGRFIARECQILIALWDGTETHLPGGTGEVVKLQIQGVPRDDHGALDPPEGFPVYQIVTPRLKNPIPVGAFSVRHIYPGIFKDDSTRAEEYYGEMFARLNAFNRAINEADEKLTRGVKQSKDDLFPRDGKTSRPCREKMLINRYAFADALAISLQQKVKLMAKLLHWSVFLAFTGFLLFAHPPSLLALDPRKWLIPSIIFLALGASFNRIARKAGFDIKYQDYRAIAEGMRVKLFWELSGVKGRVTDYYLTKQRTELDWIRNGLRGWYLELGGSGGGPRQAEPELAAQGLEVTLTHWVDDQRKYFRRAAQRDSRHDEQLRRWAHVSLAATLVMAIVMMLIMISPWALDRESLWIFILPIETALAGGALILHYNEQMAYAEHARQYLRMFATFDQAFQLADREFKSGNYAKAREYLWTLGKEALAENGDWVLLHRERPLELPPP
jgi:hypothetical protein